MKSEPEVSVIVATRNRPELLARALRSIAMQSSVDFEAIIIDDGSDYDSSAANSRIVSELGDRFRLVAHPSPGAPGTGPSESRNRGIRLARGEFVAFLDDDDLWILPDHLSVGVRSMRARAADYYFTDLIGERDGRLMNPGWVPESHGLVQGPRVSETENVFEVTFPAMLDVLSRYSVHPDSTIARRDLLLQLDGFLGRAWLAEDYNMMMRMSDAATRILYRSDCVVRYRLPQNDSVSLMTSIIYEKMSVIYACHHCRLVCVRAEVRRCARARESWTLRELAGLMFDEGSHLESTFFAWQSASTYPSPGSIAFLLKHLARAAAGRRSHSAGGSTMPTVPYL